MWHPFVVRRLAGAAAASVAAAAHPHFWICYSAHLQMQGDTVTAIDESWRFSEGFPVQLVSIDTLPDGGPLDAKQTVIFRARAFASLAPAHDFTHLFVDGQAQPLGNTTGFRVAIERGKLVYTFRLPLGKPIAIGARKVSLGTWHESLFIDYEPDGAGAVTR
ncbi:DUF1007 family protein [Burkholderia perseverans]|uniref:DUF1007 family protein n=1 Tax=Burkholderia perseverans TaxID=2615214 RepID=UPI001FF034C2|nr:DUF1007 family protein [Burkholderia perseverans]